MKKVFFKIPISKIYITAFLFLMLAVAMTVGFWFRWCYSLPALILIGIASYDACMKIHNATESDSPLQVDLGMLIVLMIIPIWLVAVGMGGFLGQEQFDNSYRNAVLYELVQKSWPVTEEVDGQEYYLSYFFTYWLPVAVIGKVFHSMMAAYAGLIIYAYIWIALTAMLVMHYCGGKRNLLTGLLLLLFIPPIIFNHIIFQNILGWYRCWCATDPILFGSPTMLYNCTFIYNQTLPVVMSIPIMLRMRKYPGIVSMLLSMIFYYGPIETVPLIPVVAVLVLKNLRCLKTLEFWTAVTMALLISIFFAGNSNGTHIKGIWEDEYSVVQIIVMFFAYICISIAVFLPFIWSRIKSNCYFWILTFSTLMLSFALSSYNSYDYGWKGPVALMFVIYLEMAYICAQINWEESKLKTMTLSMVLIAGVLSGFEPYLMHIYSMVPYFYKKHQIVGRADFRNGKLFNYNKKDPIDKAVSGSFITPMPTLYSKYFMPHHGDNINYNHSKAKYKTH